MPALSFTILNKPVAGETRKTRSHKNKQAKQKCQTQIGQCTTELITVCDGNADCLNATLPCCQLLRNCDATRFLTCLGV